MCEVYSLMLKFRSLLILVILSDRVTAILFMILWSIYRLTELLIAWDAKLACCSYLESFIELKHAKIHFQ